MPVQKTGTYQPAVAKGQQEEVMGHYTLAWDFHVLESSRMEEDTRELKCGEQCARVTRILGAKWTSKGSRVETMGNRSVQLLGTTQTLDRDAV